MAEHYDYNKPIEFEQEGGSVQITFALTCSSNVTIKQPVPDWINITPYDEWDIKPYGEDGISGTFGLSVEPSEQGNGPYSLTFIVGEDEECTTKQLIVQQKGTSCSCNNLTVTDVLERVPSEGLVVDSIIAKYSIEDCIEADYTATLVEGQNQYQVVLNNGNILLKTKIDEIERDGQTKTFVLQFKYKNDSTNCPHYSMDQASIPCSCESIDYFVVSLKRTFALSGTGDEYAIIASGDTFGCGELSATTNSPDMFGGDGELIRERIGDYQFVFKGKVLPLDLTKYPEKYLPVDTRIYFRKKDETEFKDCNRVIHIVQSDEYCDCTNGKLSINSKYNSPIPCSAVDKGTLATSFCASLKATTEDEWITVSETPNPKRLFINIEKNTGSQRTGHTHVISIVDIDPDHPSGLICEEKDVEIVQKACVSCDCYSLEPYLYYGQYGNCTTNKYNQTGETYVDLVIFESDACEGRLYTKEMEAQGIEPKVGDYRLVFCGWSEEYDHSWINGDPYFIERGIYVNINSENDTTEDRSVYFKIAVEYYRESDVEGNENYWDGGCDNSNCYMNPCMTQQKTHCKDCKKIQFQPFHLVDCEEVDTYVCTSYEAFDQCGYYVSGYTCDGEGNPKTYDWVTVKEMETPLQDDMLYAHFEKNDGEYRTAYFCAFWSDEYGNAINFGTEENPVICNHVFDVSQQACSVPCDCDNYTLYIITDDYENTFVDGIKPPKQAIAKIPKNTAPCIEVEPVLGQQKEYLSVAKESFDDDYDEIVVYIKDSVAEHESNPNVKIITTDIVVAIGVTVTDTTNPYSPRCDEGSIHITIKPKES